MNADRLLALYEQVAEAPDAVPRLRRFVLDLAVRGKLVAQDSGDEPASELLKRIAAEKARLVKAGSLGRTKAAAPTFVAEEVELPSGWTAVYGFDLFPTRSGNSKLVKGRQHSEPADDLYPGFSAAGQDVWLDNWEHQGDAIILSAVGARCGKAFRATGKWSAIANTHIIWLMASVTDPSFAMLHLNNEDFWHRSGGAQPFVKVKATLERPFPLPPLAEQRRIVAKVEELMALLDRLEAARAAREATRDRLTAASLARLTAPDTDPAGFPANACFALATLPALTTRPDQIRLLRQTILNLAVRGKLVEQDPTDEPASELLKRIAKEIAEYARANGVRISKAEEVSQDEQPFALPSGWAWTRLAALCRVVTDGDHQPPPRAETGVAFLTIGNVTTGTLDFAGCRRVPPEYFAGLPGYRTPAEGDLLYTVVGATFGRPVLVDSDEPFCVQRHIAILKPSAEAFVPYLHRVLASPFVYEQAATSTTGSAQPTVALKPLRNFLIPLPPLAEQHRIVAKVDALMALCDRLEAALTTADKTRARLLEALLHEALDPATAAVTEAAG